MNPHQYDSTQRPGFPRNVLTLLSNHNNIASFYLGLVCTRTFDTRLCSVSLYNTSAAPPKTASRRKYDSCRLLLDTRRRADCRKRALHALLDRGNRSFSPSKAVLQRRILGSLGETDPVEVVMCTPRNETACGVSLVECVHPVDESARKCIANSRYCVITLIFFFFIKISKYYHGILVGVIMVIVHRYTLVKCLMFDKIKS